MEEQEKLAPHEIMENFDMFDMGGEAQEIEDFPQEIQENVEGLMFLGELYDDFNFCGHHFVIRTLRGDEELLAALVCKEFTETVGQARAWIWALVSMCLVSIDGDENFCPPLTNNKRDYARARFQYCTRNWFWPLAVHINQKYAELQQRQDEAMARVEDLFKGSQHMSMPFAGSSKEQGDSEEQPTEDIREFLDTPDQDDSKPDSSSSSSDES